jgi:hypothetical protein
MLFLLLFTMIIIVGYALIRTRIQQQFSSDVRQLFRNSGHHAGKVFDAGQLTNLPDPVQRYFKLVLKNGQPYINRVRLKHIGGMKTGLDKKWVKISGEEYFTASNPGMIWKGQTRWFTAIDSLVNGKGKLSVRLLSLWKIADHQNPEYTQGELLRWLGESVWFPTNLLPSENLSWTAIDRNHARLDFAIGNCAVGYRVSFNDIGEITQLETKRYMDGKILQTWIGRTTKYKFHNGILIPTVMEAIWRIDGTDYSYARFVLTRIEYGKRKIF